MNLLFKNIEEEDKITAIDELIHDSTPRPSFFFLVILSTIMATFGLLIDNTSVVIGSMLIAPILSPILSLGLGFTISDTRIIMRSFTTLAKATGYALFCAAIATFLFKNQMVPNNPEILSRIEPSFVHLMIAIIAGLATAFARVKPELNEALPGTAIAVALVPPLAVSGIGLALFDWDIALGAFQMFILNAIGIILASMIMFSLMNLYTKRTRAAFVQMREDHKLQREIEDAEKNQS